MFGAPHTTLGRLTFAFISFVYLLVAVPLEERALLARHGDSYRRGPNPASAGACSPA